MSTKTTIADSVTESEVTPLPWPDKESEYKLKEVIGIGSTAHVYSAYCLPRNENCAIKIIDISKFKATEQSLVQQVKMMSVYKHPNLVSLYTGFVVNKNIWLVLSFLEGGSLRDTINYKLTKANHGNGVFDEITIATVLKSVLRGLEYLNKNGETHRNIKAANILIGDSGAIKMTDLGLTSWLAFGRGIEFLDSADFVGTACWMAPEVMNPEDKYDAKADIWSVGITAIELATGNPPYYKYPPMKVINLTLKYDPPNLDTGAEKKHQYCMYGKTFRKFIGACLKKEPSRRPTAAQLLEHPFLKRAKDNQLIIRTVIPIGPSYATRVQKVSKKAEESPRLRRSTSIEWNWKTNVDTIESIPDDEVDQAQERYRRRKARMRNYSPNYYRKVRGVRKESWGSNFSEELLPMSVYERTQSLKTLPVVPSVTSVEIHNIKKKTSTAVDIETTSARVEEKPIPVVLRSRKDGILQDVKFLFSLSKESPESLAEELVRAGLLDPVDTVQVAHYLTRLLHNIATDHSSEPVTFLLNSIGPNEDYDDRTLKGFAQLFVNDSENKQMQ